MRIKHCIMKRILIIVAVLISAFAIDSEACTGISLAAKDGSKVVARTIEWGGSLMDSYYVVVPRGHACRSFTPEGADGMEFVSKYGYVGLSVVKEEFVAEGLNEAGLSAGLFYFPGYGEYEKFDESLKNSTLADLQFVSWVHSSFSTVDEAVAAINDVHVVSIVPGASTVHWRIADSTGRQVVVEIVGGVPRVYENRLGVLTNSPGFEWQITNLNNYVNLYAGAAEPKDFGSIRLSAFGAGSGTIGLPGDVTPPSRFVRAAFYKATAPVYDTGRQTVMQCFHILNNFDIPIGIEHRSGSVPDGMMSATQWTCVSDMTALEIYYRTAVNSNIRCIDLKKINFGKVKYQSSLLDNTSEQPVEEIRIK